MRSAGTDTRRVVVAGKVVSPYRDSWTSGSHAVCTPAWSVSRSGPWADVRSPSGSRRFPAGPLTGRSGSRRPLQDGPVGVTASITTPAALTSNGTLADKSAHGELRDLVLAGLRAGRLPSGTAEVAVSKAGLAVTQLEPFFTSIAGNTLQTRLQPGEILTALGTVPFPVAERRPGEVLWRLDTVGTLTSTSPTPASPTAAPYARSRSTAHHSQTAARSPTPWRLGAGWRG